jgi:hypothetical protein
MMVCLFGAAVAKRRQHRRERVFGNVVQLVRGSQRRLAGQDLPAE